MHAFSAWSGAWSWPCGFRWMLMALDRPAVALQVGHRLGGRPVGVGQVPAVGTRGIGQVPVVRAAAGREHHRHRAVELQQQGRELGHRLAAGRIGIGPEDHRPLGQRSPVHGLQRLAAAAPADHHQIREQQCRGIGGLLAFCDQHLTPGMALQLRQPVERPGGGPVGAEGIAAGGEMPAAIQPGALHKQLAGPARPAAGQGAAPRTGAGPGRCGSTTGRWHGPAPVLGPCWGAARGCALAGSRPAWKVWIGSASSRWQAAVVAGWAWPQLPAGPGGPRPGGRRSRNPSRSHASAGRGHCRRRRCGPCRRTGCRTSRRRPSSWSQR